jgi:hypothetical protein
VLRLATDAAVKAIKAGNCLTVPSLTMQAGRSTFTVERYGGGGGVAGLSGGSGCPGI